VQPIQNTTVCPSSNVTLPATGDGGKPTGGNRVDVTEERFRVTVYRRVLPRFTLQLAALDTVG
jgi:hypothetical protein